MLKTKSNQGGAGLLQWKWQNTIDGNYRWGTSINEKTFHVCGLEDDIVNTVNDSKYCYPVWFERLSATPVRMPVAFVCRMENKS